MHNIKRLLREHYKNNDGIFNIDFRSYKKPKHIRNVSACPHPSVVEQIHKIYKPKKQKKYTQNAVDAIFDISRLLYGFHTIHELDGHILLSRDYLVKSIRHFDSSRDIFNAVFIRQHRGNNLDKKGASSYSIDPRIEKGRTLYIKDKKIKNAIEKLLLDSTPQALEKYKKFYEKELKKSLEPKNEKKQKKIQKQIIKYGLDNSGIPDNTESDPSNQTKTIKSRDFIYIRPHQKENLEEFIESLSHKLMHNSAESGDLNSQRRHLKTAQTLLNQIVGDKLYFSVNKSVEFQREYTILNQMPRELRNIVFEDWYELDLVNAAYGIISNEFPECEHIKDYYTNRDEIIDKIGEEFLKCHIDKDIGRDIGNQIKSQLKIIFLSILFGSRGISFIKDKKIKIENALRLFVQQTQIYKNIYKDIIYIKNKNKDKDKNIKNYLSKLFMSVETECTKKIHQVLEKNLKNEIVKIHDGMLIPRKITQQEYSEITQILNSYNLKIKKLENQVNYDMSITNANTFDETNRKNINNTNYSYKKIELVDLRSTKLFRKPDNNNISYINLGHLFLQRICAPPKQKNCGNFEFY